MGGILLVEDDQELRLLWETGLKSSGYAIHHAVNGLEALYQAQFHQPDLVILDLMMPTASGDLVLGFIRSTEALKHIPVLVVSAHQNVASLARQYEADAYMQKPVSIEDLRREIGKLIPMPRPQSADPSQS